MKPSFKKTSLCILWLLVSFVFATNNATAQLKVFILAGQSNMVGDGIIEGVHTVGTLAHFVDQNPKHAYLQDTLGDWITRDDVWVRYQRNNGPLKKGPLTVGFGFPYRIGPELGFGISIGNYLDEQVLIIKTAWGGKNLAVDFRPPSSGGTTGFYYSQIILEVNEALKQLSSEFPTYDGNGYELIGFAWNQGWSDGESQAFLNEYEVNMTNFISDIRQDLGVPNMKFVVVNTGIGGSTVVTNDPWVKQLQTHLIPAQSNAANQPQFKGEVALADTRPFFRNAAISPSKGEAIHHWNNNAESYYLIGEEIANQMKELMEGQIDSKTKEGIKHMIKLYHYSTSDFLSLKHVPRGSIVKFYNAAGTLTLKATYGNEPINIGKLEPGQYYFRFNNIVIPFIRA